MNGLRRTLGATILAAWSASTFASQIAPPAQVQSAGAPLSSSSAELTGRVTMILPPTLKLDPGGSVVWVPGLNIAGHESSNASMASHEKRFDPRVVAVSAGSSLRVPNMDSIYHNAFSLSPGNTFDLGLYRKGAWREVTLKTPGIVRVYCNIHPDMAASVVVVDGNAFAVVKPDGSFRISGIAPGRREVHLWSDIAGEQVTTLSFEAGRATEWRPALDASKYQRAAHTNKFGKAYPKATNGADRY